MSTTVRLATAEDDIRLRNFTRSEQMEGRIDLAISFGYEASAQTVIAERDGRLVGCGRREVRERFVNGKPPQPVAYLSGMRFCDSDKRAIVRGYGLLRELHETDGRPVTFTSVMADNWPALSMFSQPREGLPSYERLSDYVTHVIASRNLARIHEVFWNACYARQSKWSGSDANSFQFTRRPGPLTLPAKDLIVRRYCGLLRLLQRWLPAVDKRLPIGCITMAGAFKLDAALAEVVTEGWTHVLFGAPRATGWGIKLRSRLFAVRWPGDEWKLDGRPVWPEVADL